MRIPQNDSPTPALIVYSFKGWQCCYFSENGEKIAHGVHFTLVQNMLVMVPGEMWGFKGRIFGAGTM